MSGTAYPPLTAIEDAFKSLVWDVGVSAVLTYYLGGWLSIPVVGTVTKFILTTITDGVFAAVRMVVDIEAVVLVNAQHKAEYQDASIKLAVIAHDKGINSPEFKAERENAKVSLAKFVSFSGT
jgi:hypothetical protein